MIEVVGTFAEIEINDADGIDLLYLIILLSQLDVLCDGLGHAVQDALQVVELACLLYLHKNYFTLGVASLDVHAVEFVIFNSLVPLAFQNLDNRHFLVEQYGHQSFEYPEVCLVAQHTLGCPVKSNVFIHKTLISN